MRIVELIYGLLDKVAPMNEVDRADLRREANVFYKEQLDKYSKDPNSQSAKVVKVMEHWGFRTFLAALYIYLLPILLEYLNPSGDGYEEMEGK